MITIVDYGMGNLGSVANMFKKVGAQSEVTSDLAKIAKAKKILLPGVGAFDTAMNKINEGHFREVLDRKALEEKVPVLGICLGMQLLTRSSEEGTAKGLGWIDADTKRFSFENNQNLKVPHMGWNRVYEVNPSPLTKDLDGESRFYFVHSYYVQTDHEANVLMKTRYGLDFDSVITNGQNIFGAQFHPEKSHRYGMQLFKNFANLIC